MPPTAPYARQHVQLAGQCHVGHVVLHASTQHDMPRLVRPTLLGPLSTCIAGVKVCMVLPRLAYLEVCTAMILAWTFADVLRY